MTAVSAMHIAFPKDLPTQAEWWCALNGYETPPRLEKLTESQCSDVMRELERRYDGVEEAGLALWRRRYDASQDPSTGVAYSPEQLRAMHHPAATLKVLLLVVAVLVSGCGARRAAPATATASPSPVATGSVTFGFSPAPGFVIERDVQYENNMPHCILRLARAANPAGLAAYVEAPMDWCVGIE